MSARTPLTAALLKAGDRGAAPPEPRVRRPPPTAGRRVGATLPLETFIAFRAYAARHRVTGERVLVAAVERLLADDAEQPAGVRPG